MGERVIATTDTSEDDLKSLSAIIEYRCDKLKKSQQLLTKDLEELYHAKSKRAQDKICLNISIKMDFIEILLSKIVDDIMLIELIELDNLPQLQPQTKEESAHYYQ